MTDQIFWLLVALVFAGLFSSAETALMAISRTTAGNLAKDGKKSHHLIKKLRDDPEHLMATILVGSNLAKLSAAVIVAEIALGIFTNWAIGVASGATTFLILIFAEVFPKALANRYNLMVARLTILPVYWFSILFLPITALLRFVPHLFDHLQPAASVTEEELMTFVEAVREGGEINEEEQQLIHNIFEFDDTNTSEIMTPRADMFVIDAAEPLNMKTIAASGFTRIPVYEVSIDNVVGILNIKDLLTSLSENRQLPDVRQLMRPPYFVPEHKKLDSLMSQFKKRNTHMAIVVDEHGGVSGLITLEDALEELVGEIRDETDKEERLIIKIKPREWVVLGKTEIEEVNDVIGMNIPDTDGFDTFSGYVLELIGRIPSVNEQFTIGDYEIVVSAMEGNRIREYIVRHLVTENTPSAPRPEP